MEKTKIAVEVSNFQKLVIVTNWTLKALGIAFIACIWATYKGYPTPFKTVENMEVQMQLSDVGLAMSAAQEDILELHKKIKK